MKCTAKAGVEITEASIGKCKYGNIGLLFSTMT